MRLERAGTQGTHSGSASLQKGASFRASLSVITTVSRGRSSRGAAAAGLQITAAACMRACVRRSVLGAGEKWLGARSLLQQSPQGILRRLIHTHVMPLPALRQHPAHRYARRTTSASSGPLMCAPHCRTQALA